LESTFLPPASGAVKLNPRARNTIKPILITQVRDFSEDFVIRGEADVRVENSVLKSLGGRGKWVAISSITDDKRRVIYRQMRGLGGVAGFSSESIELDYDSRVELKITKSALNSEFYQCRLEVRSIYWWEIFWIHWRHPDTAHRTATRIAIISFIIAFVFGLPSNVSGWIDFLKWAYRSVFYHSGCG